MTDEDTDGSDTEAAAVAVGLGGCGYGSVPPNRSTLLPKQRTGGLNRHWVAGLSNLSVIQQALPPLIPCGLDSNGAASLLDGHGLDFQLQASSAVGGGPH
eukprot:6954776-Pyramimonas_sp.AAC.1